MLVFLLIAASLASLFAGTFYLKRALALTATATSYIRSAAQGYVVLEGEGSLLPGRSITAPFSGKPCLWWSSQVEPLLALGPGGDSRLAPNPDALNMHFSTEPFLLKDGTGDCLVDPNEATIHAKTREVWYGSSCEVSALRKQREANDDFRFVEERIDLHQRIVARGYFQTHDNGGAKTNTLTQPPDGRHFVLSTLREDLLAKRLRFKAVMALGSFVFLAACAVYAGSRS